MNISQINPSNRGQRRAFIELPFKLYHDTPQWVPALEMDIQKMFSPRHPFYKHGEAAFFMAYNAQGSSTGRLAVLHNHLYNEFNHDSAAFFYLFECVENPDTAIALFNQASAWAKDRGLTRLIGPKGFSVLDGLGMLVHGFEHRPALGLPYNLPYYPDLVARAGFSPSADMVSGYLDVQKMVFPQKVSKVAELVQKRRGLRIVRFKSRFELNKITSTLHGLYNASLEGTTGNIPLSMADIRSMVDQLFWFANPELIKIIMKDDTPVGFLLAYPDISAAVQRCHGRLFPLGWLNILIESKRTRWVNINGAGIAEKYRGQGGTALLFNEMYQSIRSGGFLYADLVQIGTDNGKMQLELRELGIDFYKTHRMYQKTIA